MQREQKKNWEIIKRILAYLRPFVSQLWVIAGCLIVIAAIGFFQPLVIRRITDFGLMEKNMRVILSAVGLLLMLVIIEQGAEIMQTHIFTDIHNQSSFNIFRKVFDKLMRLKPSYYAERNNAEILNAVQMDIKQMSLLTDRFSIMVISQIFQVISGIAGLLYINWKLTLVVLAMAPIKYFTVQALAKKKEKKIEDMIEKNRDFSQWFGDQINGINEIKLWNLYERKQSIFQDKQRKLMRNEKESEMLDAWNMSIERILEWIVTAGLYIFGGLLVVKGDLTVGGVFAFLSYSGYVTGPISVILNMRYFLSRILPSAKRLFRLLDTEEENAEAKMHPPKEIKSITFSGVDFAYDDERKILQNTRIAIKQGERVAIIGANGSGKSTLMRLLLRFLEPTKGEIQLNGINVQEYDLNAYRELFSVVSQEPYLFLDTIWNNINLSGDAEIEVVRHAQKQSGALDFIQRMPQQEQSRIGRNGAKLSGGEKQKIAVARAMVRNSPIVILDEATSGYDVESDRYLQTALQQEMRDKTIIAITHRYENLDGMDSVYRLENGELKQIFPSST